MSPALSMIVEGDSERESLPILVRRIAAEVSPGLSFRMFPPWRVPRGRLFREGVLEQHVRGSAKQAGVLGYTLIVVDADNDCPKTTAPLLRRRIATASQSARVSVVLAEREWESWFMAAAQSLRGRRGLDAGIISPPIVEKVRDAKGWIDARTTQGYSPVLDQPALTAQMSLKEARASNSFDKCFREIEAICRHFLEMKSS